MALFLLGMFWVIGIVFATEGPNVTVPERQIVDRFWTIVVQSPRRGTSFDRVYGHYVDTGHASLLLEKCLRLIKDAKPETPEASRAQLLLGLVQERRGEIAAALDAFRLAAEWDAENALPCLYLGQTLFAAGQFDEAATVLESAFVRKPLRTDVQTVLETLAAAYRRLGEMKKSEDALNRIEILFPNDPEVMARIAETLEIEGRFEDALTRYEKLRDSADDDASRLRFASVTADLKRRLGRFQDALADYDALLDRLAPESWPAESVRHRIEAIFQQQDDFPGLADFYEKRLTRHPGETASSRRLAETRCKMGESDRARSLLEDGVRKSPHDVALRRDLAELLVTQKDLTAAASQYEEINRLMAGNADILTRWGQIVLENRDFDEKTRKAEAVRIWLKRIDAAPNDPVTAVSVADLLLRNYLPEEAEKLYRRAVELRPDETTYREYLAMFYHGRRDKAGFLAAIEPIVEGKHRTPENLARLGSILLSLDYVAEAREPLGAAASLAPENVETQWLYTAALVRQGELDEAATILTRLERQLDGEEYFDTFLRREVVFLQEQGKLDGMAQRLQDRLNTIELAEYSKPEGSLPTGYPARPTLIRLLWRLAAYRAAEIRLQDATEIIEKSLTIAEPGPRFLQFAAETFQRNGDTVRALAIYDRLSKLDGVWRLDSLRRLATLQRSVGQTENALETGRLLMALGAGSAANVRFYAEMLLELGRRDEAVDALRQALRIEPGSVETLWLLAETLARADRETEAIEIAWRLFERGESTENRLTVVDALSRYYHQAGQINNLLDRLRRRTVQGRLPAEAALCMARVYQSFDVLDGAYETLTGYLAAQPNIPEPPGDELLVLRTLVDLAEKLGDFAAAVRFQEQVVARDRGGPELDRLFVLYDNAGETEKARDLFVGRILQTTDKTKQFEAIDRMIAARQYDAVNRVFDFFEVHEKRDWRVAFRRLAVDAYTGEWDITENAEEFRAMDFPGETVDPDEPDQALKRQILFLDTLVFGDPLPEKPASQRGARLARNRPWFGAADFQEARFFALGWMLKDAYDRGRFQDAAQTIREQLPETQRRRFDLWLPDLEHRFSRPLNNTGDSVILKEP